MSKITDKGDAMPAPETGEAAGEAPKAPGLQGFSLRAAPDQAAPRLARLRGEMEEDGLDAYLVPRADAHQGEYLAPRDERLAWLTGFTGSAGFAAILRDRAAVFTDGRYRIQVRAQVDGALFDCIDWPANSLADYLAKHLFEGDVVGFDPWMHSAREIATLRQALEPKGIGLQESMNLVDRIWEDQPAPPAAPMAAWPGQYAGVSHSEKRADLARALTDAGHRAAVLNMADSIAWLLNIRGADVPRTPLVLAFAILYDSGRVELFTDPAKAEEVADHLGRDVRVVAPADFPRALRQLEGPVRIDPASAPDEVRRILAEAGIEIVEENDPCLLPKARKNPAEIAATTEAHLRDGAAMCRFLHWLDGRVAAMGDGGEALTEIGVVRALEGFRAATGQLKDISFETIAGSGPNAAIVHYRVTEKTDRALRRGELLLVDSGGQYEDGTTDITRTIAVGQPSAEHRACFTRVLKGMIAISRARFPRGLAGRDLDALARAPLWRHGLDYDHGTGHGVGVYLGVHEGPQRLSRVSEVTLAPGMILSNEPGYYREGQFGIRIENLVVVHAPPKPDSGDDRDMLAFETLTWVPIDRRLINAGMLSDGEREWLNNYHAQVRAKIGPRLEGEAKGWLEQATRPV
jgi:Xaa-Pro aminopeptidase